MRFNVRGRTAKQVRNLVIVLGDQLDRSSPAFEGFEPERDAVWMAEVERESTHVPSHKARIALFLSSMRHFRDELLERGWRVWYRELDADTGTGSLSGELEESMAHLRPARVILVETGEWRVREELFSVLRRAGVDVTLKPDRHFISSVDEFESHAKGRKQLRLEYFYRELRRKTGILMEENRPCGDRWNFDTENRKPFPRKGPPGREVPVSFEPDSTTRRVIELVGKKFPDHPGTCSRFDWPVAPDEAQKALHDFIRNRLEYFGTYQDAMWTGEPFLFHSRLSSSLNLKLIDPRTVLDEVCRAHRTRRIRLASVEGFVRQVLGWREYVRGIYWLHMPAYIDMNELGADAPLPPFYWNGETEMNCLREVIGQTLTYGYANHIQRLMVTGLFALLLGVNPRFVHEWYLAVYVDAVEWVELPNTLGMSQFADGGIMASKPYIASGKYIDRMSNYCSACRYDPGETSDEDGCPFTILYWEFLSRHRRKLEKLPRMRMQLSNLERKSRQELRSISNLAGRIRSGVI